MAVIVFVVFAIVVFVVVVVVVVVVVNGYVMAHQPLRMLAPTYQLCHTIFS